MKSFFFSLFLFICSVSASSQDSSIYRLCDTIDEDADHSKGIDIINHQLKKNDLTESEKTRLYSCLIKKLLAAQKFDQCLKIAEAQVLRAKKRNNPYDEAKFYNHIGNTYFYLSNSKTAIRYYLKGSEIANSNQFIDLIELFSHNLGAMSIEDISQDQRTEAFFLKAIEYSKKNKHVKQDFALSHYRLLATLYWRQKKFSQAEKIYQNLILETQALKNTYQEAAAKIFYSKLLMEQHRTKEALAMSYSAILLAKPFKSVDILSTAYSCHAQNLKTANMPDSAYEYILQLQEIIKNNYQDGLNKQLSESAAKFKNAEAEYEKNVSISNAKKKTQLYLFGSIGIILLTSMGGIYNNARKKAQLEKEHIKAILLAEENERSRIARDIHDGIGQLLSAAKLNLHALENSHIENKEMILEKAIGLIDESAKEVRSVSHNLMPNALLKSGLFSAIKNFINQLQSDRLKINMETSGLSNKINADTELVVYRIIQECINNVIKHAGASQLFINLSIEKNQLTVMIEDNGIGFEVDKMLKKDGIGIKNIQARVAFLKGTMEINSKPNKGTLLAFHIPLNHEKNGG